MLQTKGSTTPSVRLKRGITMSALTIVALLGLLGYTAAPSFANGSGCGSGMCTYVYGSGNHVTGIGSSPTGDYVARGHVQVRWHAGGVDHFANTAEGGYYRYVVLKVDLNVNVDPNTYACARFWLWNGQSWTLPRGDWVCVKTHP
jgi:hypothetical protein